MPHLPVAKPNMLDNLIGYAFPKRGADRMAARVSMSMFGGTGGGYTGGQRDRRAMRNWRPWARTANEDTLPDLRDLRARSRDLIRNTPIATGAVATVVTNVVGDGLTCQPMIDYQTLGMTPAAAREWQKAAAREFAIWARHPDFTDRLNFDEMQALVLRSALESGDTFVARRKRLDLGDTYGLKLQLIEADRVSNPNFGFNTTTRADGVELDASGRPVGYHISTAHPQEGTPGVQRKWSLYEKGSSVTGSPLILHLYDQRRPELARGIPYLAPVIEAIKQLGDYADAEVRAAVVSAMFTVFVTHKTESDGETAAIGSTDAANIDPATELTLGNGAIVDLEDGAEPKFANPTRPNAGFDAFVNAMAGQIGVALELPREVLLKSFEASYSASRAALEMAWQFFRTRRSWLAWKFCQPVYEWVITEAIARRRLAAPGYFDDPIAREAWLGSDWIGPSRIQLDPLKEAKADQVDLAMRTKTRTQIIVERTGGTFEAKEAQRADEDRTIAANGGDTSAGLSAGGAPAAADETAADQVDGVDANNQ